MAVSVRCLGLKIITTEVGGSNLRGDGAAKFCSEFGISQFGTIYEGEEETFATKVLLLDFAHLVRGENTKPDIRNSNTQHSKFGP